MSQTGTRIGGYEVKAELGRGPIGVSHHARDPESGREVLLTTISLPQGDAPDEKEAVLRRLGEEIEAALVISHPGIVAVHEFDKGDGGELPFVVTEFVSDRTLRDLIEDQLLVDPDWALPAAQNLADALRVARDAGLAVGHLEPSGIRVRESDGVTKIAEHGVLCLGSSGWTDGVAGHVAYLAPECLDGRTGDLRSDLFSLAVILYEMMCGTHPFKGEDLESIRRSIKHDLPVPITERVENLSPAFDDFFGRALAKDPEARFPDAPSFRRSIHDLRRQQRLFQRHAPHDAALGLADEDVPVTVAEEASFAPSPTEAWQPDPEASSDVPLVSLQEETPEPDPEASSDVPLVSLQGETTESDPEAFSDVPLVPLQVETHEPDPAPSRAGAPASPPVETTEPAPTATLDLPPRPTPRVEPTAPRRTARPAVHPTPVPRTDRRGFGRPIAAIAGVGLLLLIVAFAVWGLRGDGAKEPIADIGTTASDGLPAAVGPEASNVDASIGSPTSTAEDAASTRQGIRVQFGEKPVPEPAPKPKPRRAAAPPTPKPKAAPKADRQSAVKPVVEEPVVIAEPAVPETPESAAVPVALARVQLHVKSNLKAGSLTLLVDGAPVYTAELSDESTGMGRFYKKTIGKAGLNLTTGIELPAGPHTIVVQVQNHKKDRQHEKSLELELQPGQTRGLTVVVGRSFGRSLALKLDDPS